MKFKIFYTIFFCIFVQAKCLKLVNDNVVLNLIIQDDGSMDFKLTLDEVVKTSGRLGASSNLGTPSTDHCEGSSKCFLEGNGVNLTISGIDSGFEIFWQSPDVRPAFQDCLDLNADEVNWFGGPEKSQADWPVENSKFNKRPYTTTQSDNGAVAERYWLNSRGGYIFVHDTVPLILDQNYLDSGRICFIALLPMKPYTGRTEVHLRYNLVVKADPKEAHLFAVYNVLGKPQEHPDEWIIRHPIWTTSAKGKRISDEVVVSFAKDIAEHGFTGQIQIDDYWETCYGSLTFNEKRFSFINDTVKTLKHLGFTVTLWTHPFVNQECVDTMTYGEEHGYFVKSADGNDQTSWWNGNPSHYIDFTNEEAAQWFTDRLKELQNVHGIDAFKFDAGESDYPPENAVLSGDVNLSPNPITSSYVRTCASFGGLVEVRSAWRTQDLPIFLRMIDKYSMWGLDNGLRSLIPSLLQFNMDGYVFVLPGMIGGNGYPQNPTAELIVRWTQASTFMPAMKFNYLPWEFPGDQFNTLEVVRKFVSLHEEYADVILEAMNASIARGIPVNPPIWWVDPENIDALRVNDEYMLGESILVAPVIKEGEVSRRVILPAGSWKDGNNGTIYQGPKVINDYPAPIDVLPFFIKQ